MKKYLLVLMIFCNMSVTYAADDACEAAVDAASRVNPDKDKHCDYSNTGLNGVLHRALAKKSEVSESASSEKAKADPKVQPISDAAIKASLISGEFSSAQQLETLRYTLIQKAAHECSKGFVVEGERYLPLVKGMTLEFVYHCL